MAERERNDNGEHNEEAYVEEGDRTQDGGRALVDGVDNDARRDEEDRGAHTRILGGGGGDYDDEEEEEASDGDLT